MGQINLTHRCHRRLDGGWVPAFQLTLTEGGQTRTLPVMDRR